MLAQIKRQGNSRGFTIPPAVLESLGWKEGTEVDLQVKDGALVAYPMAPSLDELLASVPADYCAANEDAWEGIGADVGKEVIE